jgi:hypothetical protein
VITLRLTESEALLVTEALRALLGKKREAHQVLSKNYAVRAFEPKDFGIPQIEALIVEIEAKQEDAE